MRVAINLLTEDPANPSGAHWFWTRVIPEMAKRLEFGEELHLLVSPESRHLHQGYGPNVFHITYPWSNERRNLRTLSEHVYSPLRLPLSRIDVFNTLMAPLVNISWSLVIHMKTMHAFTSPDSLAPLPRIYRRLNYPRSARVADAIIINSKSLRSEIERYLTVDARKLKLIYEAVDHDIFKQGDAGAARARVASYGVTKPFVLFVSSLWPYKNCDGLLRAWALARGELGDRQLAIVGPGRDEKYVARLHSLAAELGISGDVIFVGGVHSRRPSSSTGRLTSSCTRRSTRRSGFRSSGDGVRLPGGDVERGAMPETGGPPCSPTRPPPSIARGDRGRRTSQEQLRAGLWRAAQFTWARRPPRPRCLPRVNQRRRVRAHEEVVTGGAASSVHIRAIACWAGHDVVVLDAMPPVHRDRTPVHLSADVDFYEGDVRKRLQIFFAVSAVYHFAAYKITFPILTVLRRQCGADRDGPRSLPGRLELRGSSWRPLKGRWVRGCTGVLATAAPRHASRTGARRRALGRVLPRVQWAVGTDGDTGNSRQSAEPVRNVEVRAGDGGPEPGPPVRHPYGRVALQHRAGAAAIRVQRVFGGVPHLLPQLPAGRATDGVRGRPVDPRLRQHR
jgi:glycosyltransferase involved in cell wall biosynthesis